jgi:hypothetical protein
MLTLIRSLYHAIRTGDETAVGTAYWELREHIGREKASALAHRFRFRRWGY